MATIGESLKDFIDRQWRDKSVAIAILGVTDRGSTEGMFLECMWTKQFWQGLVQEQEEVQFVIEEVQTGEIRELLALCRMYGSPDKGADARLIELEVKYNGE